MQKITGTCFFIADTTWWLETGRSTDKKFLEEFCCLPGLIFVIPSKTISYFKALKNKKNKYPLMAKEAEDALKVINFLLEKRKAWVFEREADSEAEEIKKIAAGLMEFISEPAKINGSIKTFLLIRDKENLKKLQKWFEEENFPINGNLGIKDIVYASPFSKYYSAFVIKKENDTKEDDDDEDEVYICAFCGSRSSSLPAYCPFCDIDGPLLLSEEDMEEEED